MKADGNMTTSAYVGGLLTGIIIALLTGCSTVKPPFPEQPEITWPEACCVMPFMWIGGHVP